MIALAIDTSHEFGSLALASEIRIFEEVPMHEPGGFSGILFDQIGALLKRQRLSPEQIDVYAAAAGPGSFTGVRIGCTAAKALAEANDKPCFGISNLSAMAQSGTAASRAVFLDARRGEIYGAVLGDGETDERVSRFPDWLASLPESVSEFLALDFTPFASTIRQSRFAHAVQTRVPPILAGVIASLAMERWTAGERGDVAALDANYVRRSDAELLWKDRP